MRKVTVTEAESMIRDDLDSMRKIYTRMRDIAQKRIERMLKSEFSESKAAQHVYYTWEYKEHPESGKSDEPELVKHYGFQRLKDYSNLGDFAKGFSDLSKFVAAKGSTITGQRQIREKTIKTWQDQGLNLNHSNYDKAIKILEELRKQKVVYGSDKVVELADAMLTLDDQQVNDWLDNLSTLLEHSDELKDMADTGLIPVNIDDFIEEVGW